MTIEILIKENTEALRALCERLDKLLAQHKGLEQHHMAKPEAASEAKPEAKPEAASEAKPEAKPEAASEAKPEADAGAKLTRIREIVAKKGVANRDAIKALLAEHGAPSASKLDPQHYDAVLAKLEAL